MCGIIGIIGKAPVTPLLVDAQTDAIKAELKWITAELGPARELEVFTKRLGKPAADGNDVGQSSEARSAQEEARASRPHLSSGSRLRGYLGTSA